MPRNGPTYTLPFDWNDDKDNNIMVLASRTQTQDQDIATAITGSLAANGATPLTGSLNVNTNFLENVEDGIDIQDSQTVNQGQTGILQYYGLTSTTTSGTDGLNYTASPIATMQDYVDGMKFRFVAHINCIANPTFALGTLTNYSFVKSNGSGGFVALELEDLILNNIYEATYSSYVSDLFGSNCILVYNPENPYISSTNITKASTAIQGLTFLSDQISYSVNILLSTTSIDFSGGIFNFSDGTGQTTVNAITGKIVNQNWNAGASAGLLDTGTIAISTWYSLFAIYNPTTEIADYISTLSSNTAPTLPTGYTKYKKLPGAIYWNSSGQLQFFYQKNNKIIFPIPIVCLTNQTISGSVITTLNNKLPTFSVEANILARVSNATSNANGMFMYGNMQSVSKTGTFLECFEVGTAVSTGGSYTGSGILYANDGNISYGAENTSSTVSGAFNLQAFTDLDYQD